MFRHQIVRPVEMEVKRGECHAILLQEYKAWRSKDAFN